MTPKISMKPLCNYFSKPKTNLQVALTNITEYFYGGFDAIAWNVYSKPYDLGGRFISGIREGVVILYICTTSLFDLSN